MLYLWTKTLHVVFVIAWMATVFYLPRILVNIAEAAEQPAVHERLLLMGRRLYRFGHIVFGVAFLFGLMLWQGWRLLPNQLPDVVASMHWIDAKLGLVAVMLGYFIWSGRLLKGVARGNPLPSVRMLRILNELPVLLLVGIVYLVLAKPF